MGLDLVVWGSSPFTVRILDGLASKGRTPAAVVSVADRPAGRGLKSRPTPVSAWSERRNIRLFKVEDLREPNTLEAVRSLGGDLGVVASFGRIIPREYLDIYPFGFINVHPSLLPSLRGAAPIPRALMQGLEVTGITLARLDEGIDTGDIIAGCEVPIDPEDDAGSLEEKLAVSSIPLLLECLVILEEEGLLPGRNQPEEGASYAPPLAKEERRIDWAAERSVVNNLVRAMSPSPGAYTCFRGKRLKILRCRPVDLEERPPGTVSLPSKERMAVHARDGALEMILLQPEGSRAMDASEFIRGYRPEDGMSLGWD